MHDNDNERKICHTCQVILDPVSCPSSYGVRSHVLDVLSHKFPTLSLPVAHPPFFLFLRFFTNIYAPTKLSLQATLKTRLPSTYHNPENIPSSLSYLPSQLKKKIPTPANFLSSPSLPPKPTRKYPLPATHSLQPRNTLP